MRCISGDEVGLLKVTLIKPLPPPPLTKSKRPKTDTNGPKKGNAPTALVSIRNLGPMNRAAAVQHLTWADSDSVVVARADGRVQVIHVGEEELELDHEGLPVITEWEVERAAFIKGDQKFVGLGFIQSTIFAVTTTGTLHVFSINEDSPNPSLLQPGTYNLIGPDVLAATFLATPPQLALGGKEVDLTVFSLASSESTPSAPSDSTATTTKPTEGESIPLTPTFKAKNVPNTFLQLRVPIHITALQFLSPYHIVTGTHHHQLRLYDISPQAARRKPLLDREVGTFPVRALQAAGSTLVLTDTTGDAWEFSVTLPMDDKKQLPVLTQLRNLPRLPGAATTVAFPPPPKSPDSLPDAHIVLSGLDRFIRVFDTKGCQIHKVYIKQRVNCCLVDRGDEVIVADPTAEAAADNDVEDGVWETMDRATDDEEVEEEVPQKSKKSSKSKTGSTPTKPSRKRKSK
ncbi:hypothetical protein DFS34DRAFT_690142 [Phlyctochytrium arcticum]|nr:hypothetical protein DFS34DRAFT_690142 [Phlyctochytrium arcticum]